MTIETLITQAGDFIFSDVTRAIWILASVAVIGAINGIRLSLKHAGSRSYNGRIL